MATFTPSWTTAQSLHVSSTVTDGSSETADLDLKVGGYYSALVQISVTVGTGTPDGDCTVEVLGSADDGTTDDTEPMQSYVLNFTATGTKIFSFVVEGIPYAAVKFSNDTSESVTYVAKYAGVKQLST